MRILIERNVDHEIVTWYLALNRIVYRETEISGLPVSRIQAAFRRVKIATFLAIYQRLEIVLILFLK